jgi:hypothetical protein
MSELREWRLITEEPLGRGDSRVHRIEQRIATEHEAISLAGYWLGRDKYGRRGWVEVRTVSYWETLPVEAADFPS